MNDAIESMHAEDDIAHEVEKSGLGDGCSVSFPRLRIVKVFAKIERTRRTWMVLFADDPAVPVSEGRPRRAISPFVMATILRFASERSSAGRPNRMAKEPCMMLSTARMM